MRPGQRESPAGTPARWTVERPITAGGAGGWNTRITRKLHAWAHVFQRCLIQQLRAVTLAATSANLPIQHSA